MATDTPDIKPETTPKAESQKLAKEEINIPTQVLDEGFTVLANGDNPIADIVFIHGLQGHPEGTWTFDTPSNNLWNSAFRKKAKKINRVYWPRDLLEKDFHNVRILTYGYDSRLGSLRSAANTIGINGHGQNLLNSLEVIRRKNPTRPLIFIAHSLGGLIVKEMLRRSRGEDSAWRNIYLSTYAIIFFGTPHRGSAYAQLATVCEAATNTIINTNSVLLRELQENSPFLKVLREEFAKMIHDQAIEVHCFQEGKPLLNFKGFSSLVVSPDSASLEDGRSRHSTINAHHRAMCRFAGELDPGYLDLKGVVSRYLDDIEKQRISKNNKINESRRVRYSECLRSLCTPAMFERQEGIEKAKKHTFEWIFTDKIRFKDWLLGDDQLFWVKGKPGSGKSTLLKYLSEHDETLRLLKCRWPSNAHTAAFYFYDQGISLLQKSFDGLLHGILHQILLQMSGLFDVINDIYDLARDSNGWRRNELMKAFAALARQSNMSGCICVFIDALDEYDGNPWEIIGYLNELLGVFQGSSLALKICASSRPTAELEILLDGLPGLAIHDWTSEDMRTVVTQRLVEAKQVPMPSLTDSIVREAKGVFLWVKLIVDELSSLMIDGDSEEELLSMLSKSPKDLETFYSRVLERITSARRIKLNRLLQMLLCDIGRLQSLTLAELSLAVILPQPSRYTIDLTPTADLKRCIDMEKRIKSCLGGMLEVTPNGDRFSWERNTLPPKWTFEPLEISEYHITRQNVQFSHRTAKEYFIKRIDLDFFNQQQATNNLLTGHERLMQLYTFLAKSNKGMFYLLDRSGLDPGLSLDIYDTQLMERFAFHAREAEALQFLATRGQKPKRNDPWNINELEAARRASSTDISRSKLSKPSHLPQDRDKEIFWIMDEFSERLQQDPEWLEMAVLDSQLRKPSCFLTFAIANGLYLYARHCIDTYDAKMINRFDPPLLYWVFASYKEIKSFTLINLNEDEAERSYEFTQYLLEKGADPNAIFVIPYKQTDHNGDNYQRGNSTIALIHWALAIIQMINILLDNGATFHNSLYHNYWRRYNGDALKRSPVQFVIGFVVNFQIFSEELFVIDPAVVQDGEVETLAADIRTFLDEEWNLFTQGDIGKLLCRTIKAILDHGADPNAMDDHGIDVLTSVMTACPYHVVEYFLEKGALISPALLQDDGAPIRKHGILWEDRWRRPECYTPEARALVRKHMPHWEDSDDEEPLIDEPTKDDLVEGISSEGWVARISSLIGWKS